MILYLFIPQLLVTSQLYKIKCILVIILASFETIIYIHKC